MRFEINLFCRLCGEGPSFGKQVLCNYCLGNIENRLVSPGWRQLQKISVFSLIHWQDKDLACEGLLYEIKENKGLELLQPFARQMVSHLDPEFFNKALLIPLPSSTGRSHSQLLAQSLSCLTGADVLDILNLQKTDRQPGKRRAERLMRKMELRGSYLEDLPSYMTVLLIDDVVTSGGTIEAARDALSPTLRVYGLTLFSRGLSTKFASY